MDLNPCLVYFRYLSNWFGKKQSLSTTMLKIPKYACLRRDLGAPISRDRVFILLVRHELMINAARRDFHAFATNMVEQCQTECTFKWYLGWLCINTTSALHARIMHCIQSTRITCIQSSGKISWWTMIIGGSKEALLNRSNMLLGKNSNRGYLAFPQAIYLELVKCILHSKSIDNMLSVTT